MELTNNYFCVVEAVLDGVVNKYQFDYVNNTNTNLTTTITTHPIVNGDIISDHMYREPITENISGKFSLFGNNRYNYGADKLLNIQNTFERIMDEGIFCKIYKMNNEGNKSRFKIRENMVLNSIQWIEGESSLDFSFSFTEAITADILDEDIKYDVDVTDENLPALTDPETLDFTDELLNIEEVTKTVLQILNDEKLLPSEFLEYVVKTYANYQATAVISGIAVGIIALKTIATICGGLSAAVPWGTIVAAAIAVTTFVVIGIIGIVKAAKKGKAQKQYKIQAFKLYDNAIKNEQEALRLGNYIGTIHQNLSYLNDNILLYGISKNTNQDLLLYIDNVYYNFRFMKDNNTLNYGLQVTTFDEENSERFNKSNISEFCCTSIDQCNTINKKHLFYTENSGYQVFLINKALGNYLTIDANNIEKINETKSDLTNYLIMVSKINMDEFNDTLYEIIRNAMTM